MKAAKNRRYSGLKLVNTLDAKEYLALHALLTNPDPTGRGERYVKILDYDSLPAPLRFLHLNASAENRVACNVSASLYGIGSFLIEREKYRLKTDDYAAVARAFSNSAASSRRFKKTVDSIRIHLTSRADNAYLVSQGGHGGLGDSVEISTMPHFKKTDPKTLREDVETMLWLVEGLGSALYESVGRPVSISLKTRKPSDFYSLPPEFYK